MCHQKCLLLKNKSGKEAKQEEQMYMINTNWTCYESAIFEIRLDFFQTQILNVVLEKPNYELL